MLGQSIRKETYIKLRYLFFFSNDTNPSLLIFILQKTIKYPNELKYNPELKIVEKISFEIGFDAWYSINYKKRNPNNVTFMNVSTCNTTIDTLTLYIN